MEAHTPNAIGRSDGRGPEPRSHGPSSAGNPVLEYDALRGAAIVLDRSDRTRATFAGPAAAEVLTGLLTNDVPALTPGQGQYAAVLTPKGKIIADVRVFARDQDLFVDAPARASAGWWNLVRKFVNPRLARYADVSASLGDIGIFGLAAVGVVGRMCGLGPEELTALAPYAHRQVQLGSEKVMLARVPDAGLDGFEFFPELEAVLEVRARAIQCGATPAGAAAFEIARIEAGRPEWGLDMDDTTLPQEANLDTLHAISYTKGCYTGQETVARVHFRGHVNRHLRGLEFDPAVLPVVGAELVDDAERVVGDVRSVARSPRLGGVALAMVRREVQPGGILMARWPEGTVRVSVLELPFPP